jgi:phosphonate transport system substrate-binding protein
VCLLLTLGALAAAGPALAQDACPHRGDLDSMYCDANKDLVADTPTDPKKWRNPSTIVFTYTPVEDPAVYEKIFKPFTEHLAQCTAKKVVFYQVQSNAAEIEAMRSGRLHVGGFSTGPTAFAVNIAGAVPFAIKGYEKDFQGYNLIVIVKKDKPPFQKLSDLKGRKVAHTSPSSNSGHMAPMALFPKEGPDARRRTTRSCSRASTTSRAGREQRRLRRGHGGLRRVPPHGAARQIKEDDFRVIYRSAKFPTSSFAYAHDLEPKLRDKMLKCFYDYRYTPEMKSRPSTAPTASSRSTSRTLGGGAPGGRSRRREVQPRPTTRKPPRLRSERRAVARRRCRAGRPAHDQGPGQGIPRRHSRCCAALTCDRGTGPDGHHRPIGHRQVHLIRCINRLVDPTAGEIWLDGRDASTWPAARRRLRAGRRHIGMVFQEYNLVERLTVMENLLTAGWALSRPGGLAARFRRSRHRARLRAAGPWAWKPSPTSAPMR